MNFGNTYISDTYLLLHDTINYIFIKIKEIHNLRIFYDNYSIFEYYRHKLLKLNQIYS